MFFYHGVKRKRKMDRRFTTEMKFSDFKAAGEGGRGGGVEKSKQSPVGVLWKSYRYKFRKIHRKTPVSKSLLVESFRPKAYNFIKKETSTQLFSCEFNEIFKNTLLTEHLRATASRESWE